MFRTFGEKLTLLSKDGDGSMILHHFVKFVTSIWKDMMSLDRQTEDFHTIIGTTEAENLARNLYLETKKNGLEKY